MQANLYALGAIALWASLASLGVSLTHIPPFLLTGIALIIGSVPAWPFVLRDPSQWRIPLRTLALGVYGLFAYHFLLFIALRHAPPVEANLVNYLWPLFIVVLSPVVLPGVALRLPHVLAALLGFGGAAIAIAGGRELSGTLAWGYLPALAAITPASVLVAPLGARTAHALSVDKMRAVFAMLLVGLAAYMLTRALGKG